MRKYNIFVKFESKPEFEKLHITCDDIPNAIESALEFIENVNNLRKLLGIKKQLTSAHWYILSDDVKIFINYDLLNKMFQIIDYDKLEKTLVSKHSITALKSL